MNLGMPEMIFVFLLALILFGPKKLSEIGRTIGKFMAEFKRASNDFKDQLRTEIDNVDVGAGPVLGGLAQQTSSFTETLDTAPEQLMQTAKTAIELQKFTFRWPEIPVVGSNTLDAPLPSETNVTQRATVATPQASPVEAVTHHSTPDAAPASDSALASS